MSAQPSETAEDRRHLSRLLYDAWDLLDMYGDSVLHRTGRRDERITQTRDGLAAYRAARGWNPDGFGNEP